MDRRQHRLLKGISPFKPLSGFMGWLYGVALWGFNIDVYNVFSVIDVYNSNKQSKATVISYIGWIFRTVRPGPMCNTHRWRRDLSRNICRDRFQHGRRFAHYRLCHTLSNKGHHLLPIHLYT